MIEVQARWEREVQQLSAALRLAGWHQGLRDGMPVATTGIGATRGWKNYRGTIRYIEGDAVHVDFERSGLGERVLNPTEVRPIYHCSFSSPCATCQWEREHHW